MQKTEVIALKTIYAMIISVTPNPNSAKLIIKNPKKNVLLIALIDKILPYFIFACCTTTALFQGKLTTDNRGYQTKKEL